MRSIEGGSRNVARGQGVRRCPRTLLSSFLLLFIVGGLLAQRSTQAQETRERRTAVVASVSGETGSVSPADDTEIDPESRPLPSYHAPRREQTPTPATGNLLFEIAGKLALVVLVIFACAAGWKMIQVAMPQGAVPSNPALQVTSTVTLAPQRCLHLVAVGQQRLLLASTPQQIAMLGTVSPEAGFTTVQETTITALPPSGPVAEIEAEDRFENLVSRLTNALTPRAEVKQPKEVPAKCGFFDIATADTDIERSEAESPAAERTYPRTDVAEEEHWLADADDSGPGPVSNAPDLLSDVPVRGTLFRIAAGGADA
jgi:flagellar biogenesis protein FliO